MARLQPELTTKSHTILIVDDDAAVLATTAHLIRREGHQVLCADNGADAIRLCQSHDIQLMLLDYSMPVLNGEDVIKEVRSFNRDMQIVLQTGDIARPARQLLKDLDIQGFHDKSDGPERLLMWMDVALKSYEQAQVNLSLERSLLALGIALEARDMETAGHTRRVVHFSELLGQALQLSAQQLTALRQGAYLHDLGKLTIPDSILLKQGKLNHEEWTIMKTHSVKGYDLALQIPGIATGALEVVLHHHETWDGCGYPAALQTEAIPYLARIFSVCDVFDALTSERPYKAAWPLERAIKELDSQRERQFDSQIIDTFLHLLQNCPEQFKLYQPIRQEVVCPV